MKLMVDFKSVNGLPRASPDGICKGCVLEKNHQVEFEIINPHRDKKLVGTYLH